MATIHRPHNFTARGYQVLFLRETQDAVEGKGDSRDGPAAALPTNLAAALPSWTLIVSGQ